MTMAASAKSVVFTLKDAHKTKVFFKLGGTVNPKLAVEKDGGFSVNGMPFTFENAANFRISTTDYTGEPYTIDGDATNGIEPIISIDGDLLHMNVAGRGIRVYNMAGDLVRNIAANADLKLSELPAGTYMITNGVSTLKIQRR